MNTAQPMVAHVVFRFGVGGLENGIVNLVNHLPRDRWRHAIVSLTDISSEFAERIVHRDVRYIALAKRPGHLLREYPELLRVLRSLRPAIVHTRNLAALEAVVRRGSRVFPYASTASTVGTFRIPPDAAAGIGWCAGSIGRS